MAEVSIRLKYLLRKRGLSNPAHYWTGNDTVCRLASTGGLKPGGFRVLDDAPDGRDICLMCQNNLKKLEVRRG